MQGEVTGVILLAPLPVSGVGGEGVMLCLGVTSPIFQDSFEAAIFFLSLFTSCSRSFSLSISMGVECVTACLVFMHVVSPTVDRVIDECPDLPSLSKQLYSNDISG